MSKRSPTDRSTVVLGELQAQQPGGEPDPDHQGAEPARRAPRPGDQPRGDVRDADPLQQQDLDVGTPSFVATWIEKAQSTIPASARAPSRGGCGGRPVTARPYSGSPARIHQKTVQLRCRWAPCPPRAAARATLSVTAVHTTEVMVMKTRVIQGEPDEGGAAIVAAPRPVTQAPGRHTGRVRGRRRGRRAGPGRAGGGRRPGRRPRHPARRRRLLRDRRGGADHAHPRAGGRRPGRPPGRGGVGGGRRPARRPEVSATGARDGPVFVGIGPRDDVEAYLRGVPQASPTSATPPSRPNGRPGARRPRRPPPRRSGRGRRPGPAPRRSSGRCGRATGAPW